MELRRKPRYSKASRVRRADVEPYTALRWVGVLFKAAAVFLIVAVLAEVVAGLGIEGWAALPTLMGEVARTLVLAVVLWGAGDLVRLLIHLGHDIRAERVLLGRIAHRLKPAGEKRVIEEGWWPAPGLGPPAGQSRAAAEDVGESGEQRQERRPPPSEEAAD